MRRSSRARAITCSGVSALVVWQFTAEQLKPVIDQLIAHFLCNLLFQRLKLGVIELNHLAGLDIDEMFMMLTGFFISGRGRRRTPDAR